MVAQKRGRNTSAEKPTKKIRSNIKDNPRTKILNTIATLRNEKAPTNGLNRTGYVFLSSLYRDHPQRQLFKYLEIPNNELREFIYKQHQTLTKQSSLLHTKSDSVTINMNDDKMHDLLIMLWMDMSHDDLLKKESFNNFLTGSIKNEITTKDIQPMLTDLVKDLIKYNILKLSNGIITLAGQIERKQKMHMHDIWGDPSHPPKIVKKSANIRSIIRNKSKPIYVSYDSEYSSYITELLSKSKMNNGTYYLKRLFTIANLMDPGRGSSQNTGGTGKAGTSINKLLNRLFDKNNTSTPFKFNYQMFTFNFGGYFKIEIIRDGYKFNAKLNGKMMNMQIKAAVARSGNDIDKISKTFGDFIQILTVAHLRKSGINAVSSTFDGGFIGMTGFVQGTLFGMEPAIIFDDATTVGPGGTNNETGIKFHGLHKYLNYNANPERSRVTSLQKRPENTSGNTANVTQVINAKANANQKARNAAIQKARNAAIQKARKAAIQKARNEANRLAKEEANRKSKEEANRLAKEKANQNAKNEANRLEKEKANQNARNEANLLAKANANQKARNEANLLAKEKANQKARNEANLLAKEKANQNAKNEANRLAKANANQKARNEANRLAKRNEFIKNLGKFKNLDNRTKMGLILGFNRGENANNLLKDAKRLNNRAKEGSRASRMITLRSGKPAART